MECIELAECKSVAFLTTVNTDNCYLGPNAAGLMTPSPAQVNKKRNFEGAVRVSKQQYNNSGPKSRALFVPVKRYLKTHLFVHSFTQYIDYCKTSALASYVGLREHTD